jgi:hypothetical protein
MMPRGGVEVYSFALSLTLTLDGVGGNATPQPLNPRERDPVPIVQEAEWAPGPVWTGAENLAPPGFDPRTVLPVASCYTDYAIPAHC